jgi:hypothetical protein
MQESGFNTKSNFNLELLRVKAMSPQQWLDSHRLNFLAHSQLRFTRH